MSNKVFIGLTAIVVVIAGIFIFTSKSKLPPAPKVTASLSSLSTSAAPWPAEETHLADRLKSIGLSLLGAEGSAQHIHAHLDIVIHGQVVTVPGQIGIPPIGGITPVHTHDTSGIIHIESPDANATYTLGQFFDIWGVRLTDTSIGGYADNSTNTLVVYDNGKKVSDPVNLALAKHNEIVITYGTAGQLPSIPKSYKFPSGL
jgi:hypothetical protein